MGWRWRGGVWREGGGGSSVDSCSWHAALLTSHAARLLAPSRILPPKAPGLSAPASLPRPGLIAPLAHTSRHTTSPTSCLLLQRADLVVVESTLNDDFPLPMDAPQRHGYEVGVVCGCQWVVPAASRVEEQCSQCMEQEPLHAGLAVSSQPRRRNRGPRAAAEHACPAPMTKTLDPGRAPAVAPALAQQRSFPRT